VQAWQKKRAKIISCFQRRDLLLSSSKINITFNSQEYLI
jgi:hypothetical protein